MGYILAVCNDITKA